MKRARRRTPAGTAWIRDGMRTATSRLSLRRRKNSMFPLDKFDDINTRLDRIRNDLLGIKMCIITDKMYELGAISKDGYTQILDKEL
jgi:hypothetical protein